MACASRYSSAMLSRAVVGASPSQALAIRSFSTSLPLRVCSSKVLLNASTSRGPTRSNPLVGNHASPAPAQRKTQSPSQDPPSPSSRTQQSKEPSADIPPPPPPPPAENSSSQSAAPEGQKSQYAYDAASVSSPSFIDIGDIISTKSAAYSKNLGLENPLERPKVRAKAVAGRTVFIKKDGRLTPNSAPTPMVGLRVLEKMCRDQKIKNKFHSQKFHERKGLKKKRLRSQRWRARFKTGFKAAVSRVMELKKQGW